MAAEVPPAARRLEGKIALVTGGGTGIGRAIALRFAGDGARVVVAGRRSEPLQEVVREIRRRGGVATFCRGDVAKADRVELMVQGAIFNFGGLDVLVNNAGLFAEGTVLETDERKWDRVLATNLKGAFMVSRQALPALKARGGGSIINNACLAGIVGARAAAAYSAAKGGLLALTRAMAMDHASERIRVNAICTGEPVGPEDVAELALFLASDDAAGITGATYPLEAAPRAS